jgi:hypothetical protein
MKSLCKPLMMRRTGFSQPPDLAPPMGLLPSKIELVLT